MKSRAPSPALVISFVALFVALSATAFAATRITSSAQIKRGVVTSSDIKNRTIKGADIASNTITTRNISRGTQNALTANSNASAAEIVRKDGPNNAPANQTIKVIETTIPAGAYVISATLTQQAFPPTGLLVQPVEVALGHCRLDAGGDVDDSLELIALSQRSGAGRHKLQLTRTVAGPTNVNVTCDSTVLWRASNSSIIAHKVGQVTKSGS